MLLLILLNDAGSELAYVSILVAVLGLIIALGAVNSFFDSVRIKGEIKDLKTSTNSLHKEVVDTRKKSEELEEKMQVLLRKSKALISSQNIFYLNDFGMYYEFMKEQFNLFPDDIDLHYFFVHNASISYDSYYRYLKGYEEGLATYVYDPKQKVIPAFSFRGGEPSVNAYYIVGHRFELAIDALKSYEIVMNYKLNVNSSVDNENNTKQYEVSKAGTFVTIMEDYVYLKLLELRPDLFSIVYKEPLLYHEQNTLKNKFQDANEFLSILDIVIKNISLVLSIYERYILVDRGINLNDEMIFETIEIKDDDYFLKSYYRTNEFLGLIYLYKRNPLGVKVISKSLYFYRRLRYSTGIDNSVHIQNLEAIVRKSSFYKYETI